MFWIICLLLTSTIARKDDRFGEGSDDARKCKGGGGTRGGSKDGSRACGVDNDENKNSYICFLAT